MYYAYRIDIMRIRYPRRPMGVSKNTVVSCESERSQQCLKQMVILTAKTDMKRVVFQTFFVFRNMLDMFLNTDETPQVVYVTPKARMRH